MQLFCLSASSFSMASPYGLWKTSFTSQAIKRSAKCVVRTNLTDNAQFSFVFSYASSYIYTRRLALRSDVRTDRELPLARTFLDSF